MGDAVWLASVLGSVVEPVASPPEPVDDAPEVVPPEPPPVPEPVDPVEPAEPDAERRAAPPPAGQEPAHPEPVDDSDREVRPSGSGGSSEWASGIVPESEIAEVVSLAGRRAVGLPLPDGLEFVRAMRPLRRLVASRRGDEPVIDEEATAERVAEHGVWWPVTRPRRERWLDLTVVVDGGPSMALWHARVAAFLELAAHAGVFRSVVVRTLAADGPVPALRGEGADAPLRDPAEILDHTGRRVVLVVTDGTSEAWQTDALGPVLARWARVMPVSVVHLLPQWTWGRGGPAVHHARLTTTTQPRANVYWSVEFPDAWLEPDPVAALPEGTVPVPVIELDPRMVHWWAQLVGGGHDESVDATVLLAGDKPRPHLSVYEGNSEQSARQRVNRFRTIASPQAQRLAQRLAAVPVTLPVANLLARESGGGPQDVGEVVASGLLRYAPRATSIQDAHAHAFEIDEQVREYLLEGARRTETARVVRTAAHHFGHRIGALARLRAAIDDPNNAPDPVLTPETAADVAVERIVLRALAGPYASRADRLGQLAPHQPPEPKYVIPPNTTVPRERQSMSERLDRSGVSNDSAVGSEPATSPITSGGSGTETGSGVPAVGSEDRERSEPTTPLAHPPVFRPMSSRERQPDEAPPVWGNVPQRNLRFTGREDLLEQLGKRLTAGGATAVLPAALHGMGGIGKTQIAVEFVYRHLQDYEIIWWVEAGRPTQIRASLTELARHLHLPGGNDASVAIPAVREALRTGQPYRRWLLVFDAAERPDQVREFFPANGPGEILITSRNPDWAGVARPLEIEVFKREESIELLRSRRPEIEKSLADQVADRLGDLPLAVSQAAAWLAETGMPAEEYLRLFGEKVTEILEASVPPDQDEVSVTAAWNVSFDELRNRNSAAHQILQICAFFSPEPISRDIFAGVKGVSITPELDVALRDPIQLARAIRDINRYSLAKIDHANNTLQLHRLVQLVLRNRLMSRPVQAQMQHGAHQLLATADPNDPDSGQNWRRYRELLPHAYAADIVDCDDGWVRQLVINLMRFLSQWGDYEEATALARRALDKWTEALGESHPQALEVASRLGMFLWTLGKYGEAAELNQRTLSLRIDVSGENSEETIGVQTNVAIDHYARGEFAAARKLTEDILQKARTLFGADDPIALNAAYQHGISLRLSGEYRAAAELDEDTYRRSTEVYGPDYPRTYGANSARIIDRREAGEYGWARVEQEKLAATWWERFGEDRIDSWVNLLQLSVARRKDGEHDTAEELSGRVLEYFTVHFGDRDPSTMVALLAHSIDLRHQGKLSDARQHGEQAFEVYRRVLREDHPHTVATTVDLAVTLRQLGDASGARELDERAFEQFRATIGADNPYTIVAAINLASDHAALGDVAAALELGAEAVDRARRVLGEEHPTTLAATLNLGSDLRSAGRDEEADTLTDGLVARYRQVFGEAHPATAAAEKGARANCDLDPIQL